MQQGACFAGLAIENSMLGGAHALANPLTAAYGLAHGEAIGLMLPHIVRHNGREAQSAAAYAELLAAIGQSSDQPAEALAEHLTQLAQRAGLPGKLSECGVQREKLPELATQAATQWTGTFNPVEMTADDYRRLYEAAYD